MQLIIDKIDSSTSISCRLTELTPVSNKSVHNIVSIKLLTAWTCGNSATQMASSHDWTCSAYSAARRNELTWWRGTSFDGNKSFQVPPSAIQSFPASWCRRINNLFDSTITTSAVGDCDRFSCSVGSHVRQIWIRTVFLFFWPFNWK